MTLKQQPHRWRVVFGFREYKHTWIHSYTVLNFCFWREKPPSKQVTFRTAVHCFNMWRNWEPNNWTIAVWGRSLANASFSPTCSWCVIGLPLLNMVCCGGMMAVYVRVVVVVLVVVIEKREEEVREEEEQGRRDTKYQTPQCILDQTPWGQTDNKNIKKFLLNLQDVLHYIHSSKL